MPVIIFEGPEDFLKQQAVKQVRDLLGLTMFDDPNVVTLEASGLSFEDFVVSTSSAPFLAGARLTRVYGLLNRIYPKGPGNRSSRGRRGKARNQDGWDPSLLWRYLGEDLPVTTTVLLVEDTLPSGELLGEVASFAEVRSFYPLSRADVQSWIVERVAGKGSEIEMAAVSRLADAYKPQIVGIQRSESTAIGLRQLDQEIEKLCLYVGRTRPIASEDVAGFIEIDLEANIFRFVDAVYEGRLVPALNLLDLLLAGGKDPWYVYNMLAREARLLVGAHYMIKNGASHSDIRTGLGLSPRAPLDSLLSRARRTSEQALQRNYDLLIASDILRKRNTVFTEKMLVEQLAEDLCANAAAIA